MNASTASQAQPNPSLRNINNLTLTQALQPPPIKHTRSTKSRYFTLVNPQCIIGCNDLSQYMILAKVTSALRSTYSWLYPYICFGLRELWQVSSVAKMGMRGFVGIYILF